MEVRKAMVEHEACVELVRKADLECGDWVLVTTQNSVYSIRVLGNELYSVYGGWFDRHDLSPATTTINGCSWGGGAIETDVVAARGLRLEFGNRTTTTRIQQVSVVRCGGQQACN